MVALTTEGLVFTWGEGKKGQLGHGQVFEWFLSTLSDMSPHLSDIHMLNILSGGELAIATYLR